MNGRLESLKSRSARNVNPRTGTSLGNQKTAWIYGLFQRDGKCYYVGATECPYSRSKGHSTLCEKRRLKLIFLRECPKEQVGRLEIQIIKAYKRQGQCKKNKRLIGKPMIKPNGLVVYCPTTNETYKCVREAAIQMNRCTASIHNYLKSGFLKWITDGEQQRLIDYSI